MDMSAPAIPAGPNATDSASPARSAMLLYVIGLVAVAIATAVVVVSLLVRQMNLDDDLDRAKTARGAVVREVEELASSTFTTSRWDDAHANVYGAFDMAWARSNLTTRLSHSFVIDARGRTYFAQTADRTGSVLLANSVGHGLRQLLPLLPRTAAEARARTRGSALITTYSGRPAVIAGAMIVPETETNPFGRHEPRYIVYVREVSDRELAEWRSAFGLTGLHWRATPPLADARKLASEHVVDPTGRTIGYLTWERATPGQRALGRLLPALTIAALLFALTAVALIRVILHTCRALERNSVMARESAANAAAHGAEAEAARERAEASLREAQAARDSVEAAATRERAEQDRHAAQIRDASHATARALQETVATLADGLAAAAEALDRDAGRTLTVILDQQREAATVRRTADEAAIAIDSIVEGVARMARQMDHIRAVGDEAQRLIEGAAERSTEARAANDTLVERVAAIDVAAQRIAGLTGQTNLLALNATIEAARAGDAGRGFAVVAQEVKGLAGQTRQTTDDIKVSVTGIETATQSTVALVDTLHETLRGIVETVTSAARAIDDQAAAADHIRSSTDSIHATTDTVAGAIASIAGSFDTLAETAHLTRATSAEVRERAAALRGECDRMIARLLAA